MSGRQFSGQTMLKAVHSILLYIGTVQYCRIFVKNQMLLKIKYKQ